MSYVQFLVMLVLLAPTVVRAGGDEVVVLYNSRVPASKAVAEHYAAARHVPASQIFSFGLTTNETMTRADFTDFLQKPLVDDLVSAGLWTFGEVEIAASKKMPAHQEERVKSSKIRYAVLCYGMPLKIAPSSALDELAGKITRSENFGDQAAVDSELSWLPLVKMDVPLGGPLPNLLFACTNREMLSPTEGILLVSRLDGPTPEIASGLVDKAMEAETNGLWGRAYVDIRNEAPTNHYYLGDVWMKSVAESCREVGFDVDMDTNFSTFPESFPMSQIAIYAGWYDGDVSGPFKLPTVEFMPGAFAYHLHSFSAETLRSTTTHWCGPLLAKGVTCTMGCVYEPYLQFTPNIAVFMKVLFAGYTFGEAAWACQSALSWQTTVIGDPLYQPFGKPPAEMHAQLARANSPLIEWSFERVINRRRFEGVPDSQIEKIVAEIPTTSQSAVLTEKLAEIYDAQGKTDSAVQTWQAALKLSPTPQQRIRIRRTIESRLLAQGRTAEAIENDKQLLAESPSYAGKGQIEDELKSLENRGSTEAKK